MSIGRISKLEFVSEEALKQAEITYDKIRNESISNAGIGDQLVNWPNFSCFYRFIKRRGGGKQSTGSGKFSKNFR